MYSILKILLFTVVLIVRRSLCISRRKPADLVADLTLPSEEELRQRINWMKYWSVGG